MSEKPGQLTDDELREWKNRRTLRFEFTGDGREYFRIWIVNVSLTVITLGIYSAWAKVRRMRYFLQQQKEEKDYGSVYNL